MGNRVHRDAMRSELITRRKIIRVMPSSQEQYARVGSNTVCDRSAVDDPRHDIAHDDRYTPLKTTAIP